MTPLSMITCLTLLLCCPLVCQATQFLISLDPSARPIIVAHVYDSVDFLSARTMQNAYAVAGMQVWCSGSVADLAQAKLSPGQAADCLP